MFVMSMKMNKKKIVTIVLLAIVVIVLLWFFVLNANTSTLPTASTPVNENVDVPDNAARVSYLKRFGWDISAEPTEVVEAFVPQEFDDIYQNYNAIQLKQGFDLTDYQGKEVTRYTYDVSNYPDHPDNIKANLLVYGNKVIAGDICSTELDGFMHELNVTTQTVTDDSTAAQTDAFTSSIVEDANTGIASAPTQETDLLSSVEQTDANITVTESIEAGS